MDRAERHNLKSWFLLFILLLFFPLFYRRRRNGEIITKVVPFCSKWELKHMTICILMDKISDISYLCKKFQFKLQFLFWEYLKSFVRRIPFILIYIKTRKKIDRKIEYKFAKQRDMSIVHGDSKSTHIYFDHSNILNKVGENIINTIKMRNNFCYPLKMIIIAILDFALLLPI